MSSSVSARAWVLWEAVVSEHMATEEEEKGKLKKGGPAKNVDWDSGFSDG